ncbi:MAG: hypothetical protein HY465_06180, partial [Deltaproteobacteria bacterium]|nr:hypothetical protein [Deltaproteobacteria bacterium]
MPSTWKWKVWLLIGLTVLSVYLLVPTLFGLQTQREEAEISGKTLPWYVHLLPDKGLNLGLDLRGGIYLEFEVELDRAIANKIDLMVDDLSRSLKKENVAVTNIRQDAAHRTIVIEAGDAETIAAAKTFVQKYYDDTLTEAQGTPDGTQPSITFALSEAYADYLDDQIVKQALEKVRNRIDRYGVAEPSIHRLGSDRIAVELPGVQDPDRAINLIKKAGQLEFKIVNGTKPLSELA